MNLFNTTFFSGAITVVRITSGFVASKIVALYAGPSGVALIASFSNLIGISTTFSNGAISNGIVKYTAEFKGSKSQLSSLVSTAFKTSLLCSIATGSILIFFSSYFSKLIGSDSDFIFPIILLGATLIFTSLNVLITSILNGLGQIKEYTIVNSVGSILSVILTIVLVYYWNIEGALIALVVAPSIIFFFSLYRILKLDIFSLNIFFDKFHISILKKLSKYTFMAATTAVTVPFTQIVIRNLLIQTKGMDEAGLWQGMIRISDGYLLIFTSAFSTYYLPKLSMLKDDNLLGIEILRGYKIILPSIFFIFSLIFFFRIELIHALYTPIFYSMENLFLYQLVGDFFKMVFWILGYLVLAKSMLKVYLLTEVIFSLLYITLYFLFVDNFGSKGIIMAYSISYFSLGVIYLFIFRKYLFKISGSL